MSGLRVIAVLFVLFALIHPDFASGIEALDVEDVAVSAVDEAEQTVLEAYEAVLEAESAGANVSALLRRIDVATQYLASANACLRIGYFNGAVGNASLCDEALEGVVHDAEVTRKTVVAERGQRSRMTISASILGVVAVLCGCWFGWSFFKKHYYERALRMRAEVVEGEA